MAEAVSISIRNAGNRDGYKTLISGTGVSITEETTTVTVNSTVFSGLSKITVGTSQPANPTTGDLWVDTN